jgi:hypothetical protein
MSLIPFAGAVQKFNRQRGGYQIERSLRFNSADSTSLNRTPGSASNRKTWTWSGWVKRCEISTTERTFFGAGTDTNNFTALAWINDALYLQNYTGGSQVVTNTTAVFRDASAWYHIVLALDTTQATAANRAIIYVNGVQQTGFSGSSFSLNQDFWVNFTYAHRIGSRQLSSADSFSNQYMTEINFIDGSALDPTSFGEFNEDTGVWQPKAYTGSYGTNGFYLNFSDNSGVTSTTLGKDQAGSNNWTTNNFSVTAGAGNDSLVDTPTNYGTDTGAGGEVRGNYATLNPLDKSSRITLTNGNLDGAGDSSGSWGLSRSTFSFPSSGKWYWEVRLNSTGSASNPAFFGVGMVNSGTSLTLDFAPSSWPNAYVLLLNGDLYSNNTSSAGYGSSFSVGDICMVAFDRDNSKIYFGRNGTWFNSGNPATETNPAASSISTSLQFFPSVSSVNLTSGSFNFGQRPFAYTAPSGFKTLCTQNLPEPTIVDGGEYFNSVLYTGDGAASRSITGVGFQPDWVWVKTRSVSENHNVFDAVRGVQKRLFSNLTNAEDLTSGTLTSFDSDGFSLGSNPDMNTNGVTLVAWNWNAGGSNATNTDGTITATVRANPTAGFSIVSYTGTGSAATVGHGLGAVPAMIIVKNRDQARCMASLS